MDIGTICSYFSWYALSQYIARMNRCFSVAYIGQNIVMSFDVCVDFAITTKPREVIL